MTSCVNSEKKALEVRYCSASKPHLPSNHPHRIAAILGCLFVAGYLFCPIYDTKADAPRGASRTTLTPCPDVKRDSDVTTAAKALVKQLVTSDPTLRDKAATALQAMGKNAAKALADCVQEHVDIASATKAITILAKIGSDVADDCNVRTTLLSAAELPGTDWSALQFRLAAIDALGEINKYRGAQFSGDNDDPIENFDPTQALYASETLAEVADCLFEKLLATRFDDIEAAAAATPVVVVVVGTAPRPTPTPTPKPTPTPPIPTPRDTDVYNSISVLHDAQPRLLELAAQASVSASSPKANAAEPAFRKLADAKSLAASLKKIEVAYLDASKTVFAKKAVDQADDKSHWQLKTEAAYDLLSETTQLRDELNAVSDFTDGRRDLKTLLSMLANIGANHAELKPAVANAINAVFSKPPQTTPAAEKATKDGATKDAGKKDAATKDDTATKG